MRLFTTTTSLLCQWQCNQPRDQLKTGSNGKIEMKPTDPESEWKVSKHLLAFKFSDHVWFCFGRLQNLFYVTYSEWHIVLVSYFQHFGFLLNPVSYQENTYGLMVRYSDSNSKAWKVWVFGEISNCFAADWDEWEWRAESGQFFAPTRCIFSPLAQPMGGRGAGTAWTFLANATKAQGLVLPFLGQWLSGQYFLRPSFTYPSSQVVDRTPPPVSE